MTALRSGSATDVGRRRNINQDMILEGEVVFAIADGMGGHQGGEVASLAAIEALRNSFRPEDGAAGLDRAIAAANDAVAEKAQASQELRSMGTTMTAVALVADDDDELLVVANIGDSRVYLLRNAELTQLTDDHSLPQELLRQGQLTEAEAAADPRKNIVTRVLGPSYGDGPDLQKLVPYTGDRILLCSDGLYNEVTDHDIAHVLRTVADPKEAATTLVDQANNNGGADNISVIVVDVVDDRGRSVTASAVLADDPSLAAGDAPADRRALSGLMSSDQRNAELRRLARGSDEGANIWSADREPDVHDLPSRRLTARVVAFLVIVLLVLGGAAGAIGFYARGSYFVGLDEGHVAIFKGRPGGLLWFSPTVEETTELTESQVPPARADDIANGRQAATLAEARDYVRSLRPSTPDTGTTGTVTSTTTSTTTAPVPATTTAP